MQETVQEDIPVVQIHTSWVQEFKADRENLGDNDCVLVMNPNEDFYDDFKALFAEPVDKDLVHRHVGFCEPLEHVEGTRVGTQSFDIKSKKIVQRSEL